MRLRTFTLHKFQQKNLNPNRDSNSDLCNNKIYLVLITLYWKRPIFENRIRRKIQLNFASPENWVFCRQCLPWKDQLSKYSFDKDRFRKSLDSNDCNFQVEAEAFMYQPIQVLIYIRYIHEFFEEGKYFHVIFSQILSPKSFFLEWITLLQTSKV